MKEAIVTFLFLGRVPKIPGTMGTLGGFLLVLLFPPGQWFYVWGAVAAVALTAIGCLFAPWAEGHFGQKDPQPFVLDEVVGYLVTVVPLQPGWTGLVFGFILFRLFDVWKPYPARRVERFGSGVGIFLDDIVAGAYACMVLIPVQILLLSS